MAQMIDSSDRTFLTLWSLNVYHFIYDGGSKLSNDGMRRCLTVWSFCNELMMFHLMHFQRSKTFSECFEMILKRYWTFLSSVGEHCQRFQMHWECSPMHFNVFKCVVIKNGSTQFSLSPLFPNRVTFSVDNNYYYIICSKKIHNLHYVQLLLWSQLFTRVTAMINYLPNIIV